MSNVIEALCFPFKRSSLKMFIGLCLLFLVQFGVAYLPVIGLFTLLFLGYIYATQLTIIFTTGNGYTDAPEFPDFSDIFDSVLMPIIKIVFVWGIGWLPFLLLTWQSDSAHGFATLGTVAFGFAYVPIGLMIVAMDDIGKALNPIVLFGAVRDTGWTYFILVGSFAGFYIGSMFLTEAFAGSWILNSLFGAYGIMFTGRLIGSVYRDRLADNILEDLEDADEVAG
jgi:hypothetical protein